MAFFICFRHPFRAPPHHLHFFPSKLEAIHETAAWAALREHAASLEGAHLRDMMADADRCAALTAERGGILLDYSRQRVTNETMVRGMFLCVYLFIFILMY